MIFLDYLTNTFYDHYNVRFSTQEHDSEKNVYDNHKGNRSIKWSQDGTENIK